MAVIILFQIHNTDAVLRLGVQILHHLVLGNGQIIFRQCFIGKLVEYQCSLSTLEKVVDRLCDTIRDLPGRVIQSITGRKWIMDMF